MGMQLETGYGGNEDIMENGKHYSRAFLLPLQVTPLFCPFCFYRDASDLSLPWEELFPITAFLSLAKEISEELSRKQRCLQSPMVLI